ncbi:hypothetical protein COX08_03495 [Candidatus Beckwithbacteria bacterium CG23_combo_of_CG06-09_8_20_14_all_34_8]|uniref:Ribulose-phosphate 3-epimerase n=1 Tax=Candidatus Beckwithbacteria bacterium CG23_combo_of_CG06-09_8_20_14_all_34_8 TaxID=1974497 RepID=A0A2H0B5N2_9BACT|nr:MAG: hypothetical protein COX08_03495 [Candidatus Beckwithbacteria bacterium CG23_combo_of_CG06-09_8_20_14_all_34_8]
MPIITPTILESNILDFDEKLLKIQQLCSRIQIDIIDGKFVDNKTLYPEEWPQFGSNLSIDVHLMVLEPETWLSRLKIRQVETIIGQYEAIRDIKSFFENTLDMGKKIGLALDIDTPVTIIEDWMMTDLSVIVLMAIKTGYSGQEFDDTVLPKIEAVRQIVGYSAEIIVDGGINLETGKQCVNAGADVLACNTFFWQNPENNLTQLSQL